MITSSRNSPTEPQIWCRPRELEVVEDPAGLRVYFDLSEGFFDQEQAAQESTLAAAAATLTIATIQTAAGWQSSAGLVSITTEFLSPAAKAPLIGTGVINLMGTNIAFVGATIMAGDELCLRATGSGRIEKSNGNRHYTAQK